MKADRITTAPKEVRERLNYAIISPKCALLAARVAAVAAVDPENMTSEDYQNCVYVLADGDGFFDIAEVVLKFGWTNIKYYAGDPRAPGVSPIFYRERIVELAGSVVKEDTAERESPNRSGAIWDEVMYQLVRSCGSFIDFDRPPPEKISAYHALDAAMLKCRSVRLACVSRRARRMAFGHEAASPTCQEGMSDYRIAIYHASQIAGAGADLVD